MRSLTVFLTLALFAVLVVAGPIPDGARDTVVHYAGYRVLTFTPESDADIALIQKHLQSKDLTLQQWTRILQKGTPIDIQFSPSDLKKATPTLVDKVAHTIKIADLGPLVDADYEHAAEVDRLNLHKRQTNIFTAYQPTATYLSYLQGKGGSLFTVGTSFQGTTIQGVKIGAGTKKIVIHGGIHAREWISPAVVTYIGDQLLSNSSFSDLTSAFTFYIIPVLNVDGYAYTRSNDRLWRKNRQTNSGSSCIGDLNRNFGYQWGGASTSSDPCDNQIYRGKAAFEAVETKAIANFITSLGGVVSYIDFHSYSQLWMYPWGYSCSVAATPDEAAQRAGGAAAVAALRATNGVSFTNQRTCQLYAASGVSNDWYDLTKFNIPSQV
ncbi:hypothetical protein BJ742DRAFT_782955 [Cladochytrium replicatum]|nr:hypothetical protein BJ742DRAFT_782955 [Cladochytrium replicatum]